jgi:hypothetical protein
MIVAAMKYPIKKFTSLTDALRELGPYVRNGQHLLTGKPFRKLGGLRSREAWALWLICAAANRMSPGRYDFTSEPLGGDGALLDTTTNEGHPTEHIMIPRQRAGSNRSAHDLIIEAVRKKNAKGGPRYAKGKILVAFVDSGIGTGLFWPNRLRKALPGDTAFDQVWIVSLLRIVDGQYIYAVSWLYPDSSINCPVWLVVISPTFDGWQVAQVQ